MMHLETKPIGELLLDVLADYGAAYAGGGSIEELGMTRRRKSPAKEHFASANGHERAEALNKRLFAGL